MSKKRLILFSIVIIVIAAALLIVADANQRGAGITAGVQSITDRQATTSP